MEARINIIYISIYMSRHELGWLHHETSQGQIWLHAHCLKEAAVDGVNMVVRIWHQPPVVNAKQFPDVTVGHECWQ